MSGNAPEQDRCPLPPSPFSSRNPVRITTDPAGERTPYVTLTCWGMDCLLERQGRTEVTPIWLLFWHLDTAGLLVDTLLYRCTVVVSTYFGWSYLELRRFSLVVSLYSLLKQLRATVHPISQSRGSGYGGAAVRVCRSTYGHIVWADTTWATPQLAIQTQPVAHQGAAHRVRDAVQGAFGLHLGKRLQKIREDKCRRRPHKTVHIQSPLCSVDIREASLVAVSGRP